MPAKHTKETKNEFFMFCFRIFRMFRRQKNSYKTAS